MATAGHYKELTDGYELIQRADGLTGTRTFIDGDAAATDSLPEIDDLFDATDEHLQYLKCIEIRKRKHGNHPEKNIYTVSYSTSPGASDSSGMGELIADPNFLPVTGSLGAEAISIDGKDDSSAWVWEDDDSKMDQQIFKKIITGEFKLTRRMANLPLNTWCEYNGKINNATMKVANATFPISSVMFNGAEYEEYRNDFGNRRWKVDFSFSVRLIPSGDTPATYYGWNWIYDEKTNKVRRPYNPTVGAPDYMYESANLNSLFADVVLL